MHIRSVVVLMALPLVFCAIELACAPIGNFAMLLARWAPALVAVGVAAAVITAERRRRIRQAIGAARDPAPVRHAEPMAVALIESERPRPDCRTA